MIIAGKSSLDAEISNGAHWDWDQWFQSCKNGVIKKKKLRSYGHMMINGLKKNWELKQIHGKKEEEIPINKNASRIQTPDQILDKIQIFPSNKSKKRIKNLTFL